MARRVTSCLFLLFVWCVVSGLLMNVTAEPTVTATILTPVADRKEGGVVHMRCVATNLEEDHIVEWRTENPIRSLRFGVDSFTGTDYRFTFETIQTDGMTIQNFNISDLQRDDTDEYVCNVNDPIPTGGSLIVATDMVTLSVLYFPSQPPMCSPDGPITSDTGSELNMTCSSEAGNSAVIMTVSQTPTNTNQYTWMQSTIDDTLLASINLMVDEADASFECIISSTHFPDMKRSCTIGPIYVTRAEGTPKEPISKVTKPMTVPTVAGQLPDKATTLIAVSCTSLFLLTVSIIINILLILKHRHLKTLLNEKNKADPYTELQPTGERNRDYMEPEGQLQRGTTTIQHTYFQSLGIKNDEPEEGYEKPNAEKKYETIVQPQP